MSQRTLSGEKVQKRKWKTKRFLEYVYENCLNCGKELKFSIYEEADEFDAKTGKPTWDSVFVHGEQRCKCGAEFLVADDMENVNIYWLNQKDFSSVANESSMGSAKGEKK
jgi:hypothetical protein